MHHYLLHVRGTHCNACKILIEDTLGGQSEIEKVHVDLKHETVAVDTTSQQPIAELVGRWTKLIEAHKYHLSLEKETEKKDFKSAVYALPLGLMVLGLFILLQKSGIVNLGFEGGLSPATVFFIGVVASLSSCLAVVGGLTLSLSAEASKDAATARPFVFFHIGRLVGFAILGGLLGLLGSTLNISPTITNIFGLLVAFVMILLGINLLDIFHITKKFRLVLPSGLFRKLTSLERGWWAPFIVGAGTFFLPCGFTQSMQFAALSSGSIWNGMLIMSVFAVGTLPMLALLSFGSYRFSHTRYSPLFFKTAGVVVIGLGLIALLSSLAAQGIIPPVIIF